MIGYICSAITDIVVTFAQDSNIVNLHNLSLIHIWQCALRRAGEYRAAHGDLTVPVNYKTEDGFCLGDWIRRMRESYAAHDARLTPERVENLSALGMVWAPAEG